MRHEWRTHLRQVAQVGLVVLALALECVMVLAIMGLAVFSGVIDRGIAP